MKDHSVFVRHSTYVQAPVTTFSIINRKAILLHFGAPLREGGQGRSGPLNLRGGVTYGVTP